MPSPKPQRSRGFAFGGNVCWLSAFGFVFKSLTVVLLHSLKATNMTAHFLSLPNELICEILKLIQPEDLENFAQTSRNVYSLAVPFLTAHRALIRKYHTLRNNTSPRSITDLLSQILANPCIGSYVRKVELSQLELRPLSDSKVVYTKEELEIFTTAALDSECLQKPLEEEILDERDFYSQEIQVGNDDILLAILLPLLPNLVALSAEPPPTRISWYDKAVEKAAFATTPTLSKLTQIRLDARGRYGIHLAEIQKFSALPSVRVITALKACGMDCLHEISPDTNSHVTHLKLWESTVDAKALYEFLRGFGKLQSFTYSYSYTHGTPNDAFLIRASLLAHCKATLQSLTLLNSSCRFAAFMGSLTGFEHLREVYTEWVYLIPPTHDDNLQLNAHLPASLVRLKIHDSQGREKSKYERAIKSAQYAREHRLQKLKWLVFGGTRVEWSLETIDWRLTKTCSNMGITLIFSPYAPKSGD